MTDLEIYNAIERAINSKSEIELNVKYFGGEKLNNVLFQPYILGDDYFQYGFVWGYLSHSKLYYKCMLDIVNSVKVLSSKFEPREDACYQYAIEEDHFARLEGFTNIYGQAASISEK